MSGESANLPPNQQIAETDDQAKATDTTDEPLHSALSGKVISNPDEAYWAPPLITMSDLFGSIGSTLKKNPGSLMTVLFAEQPDVPYAPDEREELASRRTTEQLKFLGLLLLIVVVIGGLIYLLF